MKFELTLFLVLPLLIQTSDFSGIYEYKSKEEKENHFIILENIDGNIKGEYYGSEDGKGHGIFYFKATMEKLQIDNNGSITFEIEDRMLYETTRLNKREPYTDVSIGRTRYVLNYSGRINSNQIQLKCNSEFEECWTNELLFRKIRNGR